MIRLKIKEIHVKFFHRNAGALWGALIFLKRPMSVLFSFCANLSKILNMKTIYRRKVLVQNRLECLILRWLLIRYFRKQHLSRGKGEGREELHVNESLGKK